MSRFSQVQTIYFKKLVSLLSKSKRKWLIINVLNALASCINVVYSLRDRRIHLIWHNYFTIEYPRWCIMENWLCQVQPNIMKLCDMNISPHQFIFQHDWNFWKWTTVLMLPILWLVTNTETFAALQWHRKWHIEVEGWFPQCLWQSLFCIMYLIKVGPKQSAVKWIFVIIRIEISESVLGCILVLLLLTNIIIAWCSGVGH